MQARQLFCTCSQACAQVCSGKQTAERVESWIDASYAGDLHLEVRPATAAEPCLHAQGRTAATRRPWISKSMCGG